MNFNAIRDYCMKLPGTTHDIKWQIDDVFSVGGKMYCVMCTEASHTGISFKVEPARFLELTDQPGIIPAPYLARHHWVRMADPTILPAPILRELLGNAYHLVRAKLPKKTRDALGPIAEAAD